MLNFTLNKKKTEIKTTLKYHISPTEFTKKEKLDNNFH